MSPGRGGERGVAPTDPPSYLAEHDQLTLAHLLLAEGDARPAPAGRRTATAGDRTRKLRL
ncbi:MAG: hypothetical protein ACLP0J_10330 [Solirubrobacteraceae bacterium]|jgi:hypothetical protein